MARRRVSKYSSILRRRRQCTHSQLLHDANARQQRCEKSLGVSGTKFKPQELNTNPNSAPAQIARAPNRGKIRKFSRVQTLTGASFSQFFICDYIHCAVCLPLWIVNLSLSPLLYVFIFISHLTRCPIGWLPRRGSNRVTGALATALRAYRGGFLF